LGKIEETPRAKDFENYSFRIKKMLVTIQIAPRMRNAEVIMKLKLKAETPA